ncbi:MAG: DUF1552 domain-containing protein [Lentisphaerales bacterium]|nr:DUF1552 domain-containing protein [Lentisphaerales bacterium]
MDRRNFLKLAGCSFVLPNLDVLANAQIKKIKRLMCVTTPLGMIPEEWFPKGTGSSYTPSKLLKIIDQFRSDFTVFSNLDHGKYGKGGHSGVHSFLSGVRIPDSKGFPERNISIDMKAAMYLGKHTRFPYLNYRVGGTGSGGSFTKTGVQVPTINDVGEAYKNLFLNESVAKRNIKAQEMSLDLKILSSVYAQAKPRTANLGKEDREKFEEYFNGVNELGKEIQSSKKWVTVDKPKTSMPRPASEDITQDLPLFYELIFQAFNTDSTRVATLELPYSFDTSVLEVDRSYHGASHHGKAHGALEMMYKIESFWMKTLADFVGKLKSTKDPLQDGSLLDNTVIVFGSGLGNSSSHDNSDLPVMVMGGGFKHKTHLICPGGASSNKKHSGKGRLPLSNLWLSVLQQVGCPIGSYNRASTTLNGFEPV